MLRAYAEKTRRNPNDPYAWAMTHRNYAGRSPLHLPALADIYRDDHPLVVVQKSAQIGLTELLVNKALWAADTAYAGRGNVLFLMPTQNQMDDFAQARFDRAIQDSAYLRRQLQPDPPRRKGADSKRLKRVGPGYIYLRGADSQRQVASVDADIVLLDEFDQMAEGTFTLAQKRLASSRKGQLIVASTPRFPEAGVNGLFLQSDRRRYHLTCRGCATEQALEWKLNIDFERALVVCNACREPLDVTMPGRWIAEAPGNDRIHGYHLSRLYSPWANIPQMIEASEETTPAALQEFYNSDLGETFSPPGGGLTLDILDRCRQAYSRSEYAWQPCVVGVDVGTKLHVVVRELPSDEQRVRESEGAPKGARRLWYAGELDGFAQLETLMTQWFTVKGVVIDALPETRQATEFARRHPGQVWLAYYGRQQAGYEQRYHPEADLYSIHVNRTEAVDETFERFRGGVSVLPQDARSLGNRVKEGSGEYYRELLAQQRTLTQNADGNWVARWLDHGRADHYAHAEVYAMLVEHALTLPFVGGYLPGGPDGPGLLDGLQMVQRY